MAITKILTSDKVQVFRTKFNSAVDEIWVSAVDNADGTVTFTNFAGGSITLDLTGSFFTKDEIQALLVALTPASYLNAGSIRIATVEEVDAGEDENIAITPYTAKNSTLFPLKGTWIQPDVLDPDILGYRDQDVVFYNGEIYVSILEGNKVEPGTDDTKWTKISAIPLPIVYTEANLTTDVDSRYYLPISKSSRVLEIKYKVTAQTKTYRMTVENALEEDTTWDTNRIYNFPTNDSGVPLPQTITITTI